MTISPKVGIQNLLKRLGLYQRVKFSFAYDLFWWFADRKLIADRTREIQFFREILQGFGQNDLIFDIGANMGQKTDVFLRLGASVLAVDPDQSNQEILRQNFLCYRLRRKPVVIVGKAVSDRNGKETLWINEPGSAKNTLNPKWVEALRNNGERFGETLEFGEKADVETVTLESLIESHGRPFYIKIDVEGYEAAVLRGLRTVVRCISFEVNLPEFEPEALECLELLEGLAGGGRFNYTVDCCEGMALPGWLGKQEFRTAMATIDKPCIEVFWKAPGA